MDSSDRHAHWRRRGSGEAVVSFEFTSFLLTRSMGTILSDCITGWPCWNRDYREMFKNSGLLISTSVSPRDAVQTILLLLCYKNLNSVATFSSKSYQKKRDDKPLDNFVESSAELKFGMMYKQICLKASIKWWFEVQMVNQRHPCGNELLPASP